MNDFYTFLDDFDTQKKKDKNIKPENIKLMNDSLEKYLFLSEKKCTPVKDFKVTATFFESHGSVSTMLYTHIYNELPSVDNISDRYTTDLLDYLYEVGELIYSSLWDYRSDRSGEGGYELTHYFLYNNTVTSARLSANGEDGVFVHSVQSVYASSKYSLRREFAKFILPKKKTPTIGIIKQKNSGLYVHRFDLTSKNVFDFGNYNDDFPEFWQELNNKLTSNTSGLYLFHGEPGTGKSSAIRHLISQCYREFIFVPPQMVHHLATPEFSDILTGSAKGAVLVIEDAEKALIKRETDDGFSNSTLVSSILNITDGLYADLTNISIIATYNCDRNLIDPALLRKGRMRAEYQFKKLEATKAQVIMDSLGHDTEVTEDMSLADIFNYKDQYSNNVEGHKAKRVVGFSK